MISEHCDAIEIGEHRYGVVMHDGKPHVLGWVCAGEHLPRAEDLPAGYGVIRTASASLKLLTDASA